MTSHDHKLFETSVERPARPPDGLFSAERVPAVGGATVVALAGELDLAAVEALRRAIGDVAGTAGVILDLEKATFVDSSGLRELLAARAACEAAGVPLVLAAPSPQLLRLLDLTGTDGMLVRAADREAALRVLSGRAT
jgi:stage II sporulation protein AA (anti-sigma F factor antagonist)